MPVSGARSTRSPAKPPISPGMFVFGIGSPSQITLPSVCPRMVSMTAWQSRPAQKPGPSAITSGASVIFVPRFRFARIPSTRTSGCSHVRQDAVSSGRTGISPTESAAFTSRAVLQHTPTASSTVVFPKRIACEKQTVLRMAVGCGRSVMTTGKFARCSRSAAPEARSPAPRISTSISSSPLIVRLPQPGSADTPPAPAPAPAPAASVPD